MQRMHGPYLGRTAGRRALVLLVGCGILVAGCASATPTPTRTPRPIDTPMPTETPEPTATPTPTPLPENVNPLTGEVVEDSSVLQRVPAAIKIANTWPEYVRPQAGINSADLIFEHYNEGWFSTRWTAIYLAEDPVRVGSVRSCRLIDLELPAMYRAVMGCSGFSDGVLELARQSDLYPDWIASPSVGVGEPVFFRDFTRDVPLEHTMFSSPAVLREWADARGISGRQELEGMVFSEEPTVEGQQATYVQIPWYLMDAEWRYDEETGLYLRWSDGEPHSDALDGEQLSAANVVVLYVSQWDTDIVEEPHGGALSIRWALWNVDNPHRPAVLFRDGIAIDCVWQREERADMLTLTDDEGTLIPLKVGNTFFEVLPTLSEHYIEIVVEP